MARMQRSDFQLASVDYEVVKARYTFFFRLDWRLCN